MNILKKIGVRIIPVAVLTFILVAAIAYQRGLYDLTFIKRNSGTAPSTETTAQTTLPPDSDVVITPPESDTAEPPTSDTAEPPVSDTTPPESAVTTPPAEQLSLEKFLADIQQTDALASAGYTVTDTVWSDAHVLTRLTLDASLPSAYSLRTRVEKIPERVPHTDDSGYSTVINETDMPRPAAEVYMDYLLIDNGKSVDVYSRDGVLLMSDLDTGKYKLTYSRDKNDRPLFHQELLSQTDADSGTVKYYYIDENGEFAESDYNDRIDGRGLYMNYPSYYGKSDNANAFVGYSEENDAFGYLNASSWPRTEMKYSKLYNFSDGLGCYIDEDGFMHWLDNSFVTRVSELPRYGYNGYHIWSSSKRRLYHVYLQPDTFGAESRGMFYFDNGLVLVRRQTIDAGHYDLDTNSSWDVVTDVEILIRSDDTEFPLPRDYTLVSYSNGMILLEKDDSRGFMDYTGKWIVQPVYDFAEPFCEGLAVIGKDGKVGLIDTNGNFVIPMLFDKIENVSGGIVAAWSSTDGWVIFNKMCASEQGAD